MYRVSTWWRSFEDFTAWTRSPAFAEAHRRAIAESPRDKSGFGFGAAGATPASARASSSGTPRFFAAARRPSSAGKHGLQLVRESLDEELEKAIATVRNTANVRQVVSYAFVRP